MARLPRLNIPNVPQHVVQRGNNRQITFATDDDYKVYLDRLKHYAKQYGVLIHAYVLMTNHVHLLVTPTTEKGVSQLMQSIGRYYVRYFNNTYQRTGTLWEGRYKSTLVSEDQYLLLVYRYIELNPVRANMVSAPNQYPWSSYHHNVGGKNIIFITEHQSYLMLGDDKQSRCENYKELFRERLSEVQWQEIHDSTDKAWVLGNIRFKQQIEEMTGRRATPLSRGGDRKSQRYKAKLMGQKNQ